MQRIVKPRQTRLFDPFDNVLTEKTHKRLLDGSACVFRHIRAIFSPYGSKRHALYLFSPLKLPK